MIQESKLVPSSSVLETRILNTLNDGNDPCILVLSGVFDTTKKAATVLVAEIQLDFNQKPIAVVHVLYTKPNFRCQGHAEWIINQLLRYLSEITKKIIFKAPNISEESKKWL